MNWIAILQTLLTLISLIAIGYAAIRYIDQKISKSLKSPEHLEIMAKLFRPSVIFDSNESILADQGAMNHIKSIKIEYAKNVSEIPNRIVIDFNKFIALPPLLTSLDSFQYNETVSRGKYFSWIYDLETVYYQEGITKYRFRVEILSLA